MPETITQRGERPWENVERMIDVDHALDRILAAVSPLSMERVPLLQAAGKVRGTRARSGRRYTLP